MKSIKTIAKEYALVEFAKGYGAKGLAYLCVNADGTYKSSFAKFMTEEELANLVKAMNGKAGDLLLFAADKNKVVFDVLGALRIEVAKQLDMIDNTKFNFLWVTEFPLLEWDEEEKRFVAVHHPFTMPMDEDLPLLDTDPGAVRAKAYDIVLNGTELGGGSVRIHQSDVQELMFEKIGFTKEEAYERFSFLLDAFKYGVPPHAGLATLLTGDELTKGVEAQIENNEVKIKLHIIVAFSVNIKACSDNVIENVKYKVEETEREITGRLIIIDEMSMVDTWLAHQLLKALHEDVQVIFVGDQDQLPPVGPGQVLKDLLASQQIPTVELTDVYRQAEGSTIIEMAHQIKKGIVPNTLTAKTSDRSFIQASAAQVTSVVTQIVKSAIAKGQAIRDVQVLAPMYKGPAGIDNLNKEIQQLVNPNDGTRKEIVFGDTIYRIGDKVLQLVNQPENNVFNGDMGEVISIIRAKETVEKQDLLIVSYDGIEVTYQRSDLNQITLAYCCSIHKSQGSEFQTVIMPVVRGYSKMLRRNLLYTGITRAKNFLIICGEPDVLANGLAKTDDLMRLTSLKARLDPSTIPTAEVVEITEQSKDEPNNEQAKEKKQHTTEQLGLLNVTESHEYPSYKK